MGKDYEPNLWILGLQIETILQSDKARQSYSQIETVIQSDTDTGPATAKSDSHTVR